MRSFTALGLLPSRSLSIPLCKPHWPPGSSLKGARSPPCSQLCTGCSFCLNTFPPDSHMSLSLHPTLWVSARRSPFQRERHPGKTSPCTITLHPVMLLYFSPLLCLQLLLPSPCTRTGTMSTETLFHSLLFPQPKHLTRATQALCVPVAVQFPGSPVGVSAGG